MFPTRRAATASFVGLVFAALAVAAPTASRTVPPQNVKPVIAEPMTVPAQPQAGQRFAVSFKVTRSDNHKPLLNGLMICDPAVAGKVIAHQESFRAGTARLAFLIPSDAQGKVLKVNVTIKSGKLSAHKVATFQIPAFPKLAIADASVAEGSSGTTTLSLPVTLSAASTQSVAVNYATADGTAVAASDYTAANGTLTFKPGETTKSISVSVTPDTAVEQDETLTVALSNAVGATILDSTATATITNDDVAPRSGHYAGTTSQGRSIAFDVSPDLKTLTGLAFYTDVSCTEVPVALANVPMTGMSLPIGPDWGFGFNAPHSNADGTVNLAFSGKLSPPGSASGTLRIDITLNDGPIHCSTGDLTWNAG